MTRYRFFVFLTIIILIPLGLFTKFYKGPFEEWVNHSSGGIFYEIFWSLLVILINPQIKPSSAVIGVFIITALLEFLQLWNPPFLAIIRATWIGRILIGTSFDWWDFPHYLLGCTITWLGLKIYQRQTTSSV